LGIIGQGSKSKFL